MVAEPVSIVYGITLEGHDLSVFNKKLPSGDSMEMFGQAITEGESDMEIQIYKDKIIINITFYFRDNMTYSDIKIEMKRIIGEIETFLNEPE